MPGICSISLFRHLFMVVLYAGVVTVLLSTRMDVAYRYPGTVLPPQIGSERTRETDRRIKELQGVLKEFNETLQKIQRRRDDETALHSQHATRLPSCADLMSRPGSKYAEGGFITRHTVPHRWTPRRDGSRAFDLTAICSLKRYTADEARTCLADQHLNFIGDSLSRYQFNSLAYLIHKGNYPPRFPSPMAYVDDECSHHIDEDGNSQCSPIGDPNICTEVDWFFHYKAESWEQFYQRIGGGSDGGVFDGRMECNCARKDEELLHVENMMYVSPPNDKGQRTTLSIFQEKGHGNAIRPIRGHYFTGCAYNASCRLDPSRMAGLYDRMRTTGYDYSQYFPDAILKHGVINQFLPPVNVSIYNRGLWGELSFDRARQIFPAMRNWTRSGGGRCFYKSTTGCGSPRAGAIHQREFMEIRGQAADAGCSFLDYGHITADFAALYWNIDKGPVLGDVGLERTDVYFDMVHYQPWVYEELNNVLLNVLCNGKSWT